MSLLTVKGLKKQFFGADALDGVNLELSPGRITGLLGPNGSGKTTLMKVVAGLLQPDEGTIEYPGGARRGIAAKRTISFLPDAMELPAWMRVSDAFHYYQSVFDDYSQEKANEMIRLLELPLHTSIRKLSKGMQERVSLGLTFSRLTSLYLLDEPLGGIDPVGKMKILDSILSMQLEQSAILLSTHLVKDVETIFDNIYLLSRGKIAYSGDCEAIREESGRTVEQVYLEVFANA